MYGVGRHFLRENLLIKTLDERPDCFCWVIPQWNERQENADNKLLVWATAQRFSEIRLNEI